MKKIHAKIYLILSAQIQRSETKTCYHNDVEHAVSGDDVFIFPIEILCTVTGFKISMLTQKEYQNKPSMPLCHCHSIHQ